MLERPKDYLDQWVCFTPGAGALKAGRVSTSIGLVVGLAIIVCLWVLELPSLVKQFSSVTIIILMCVDAIETVLFLPVKLKNTSILLSRSGVIIKRGICKKTTEFIPIHRITVIKQTAGIINKRFGLLRIEIMSVTTSVVLPSLSVRDSIKVTKLISNFSGVDIANETS